MIGVETLPLKKCQLSMLLIIPSVNVLKGHRGVNERPPKDSANSVNAMNVFGRTTFWTLHKSTFRKGNFRRLEAKSQF